MTSAAEARDRSACEQVWLVEVTLGGSGPTLYLSDKEVTVGGLGYQGYIDSVEGVLENVERATSLALNPKVTVRFVNERYAEYAQLIDLGLTYPFEAALCVIKEAFIGPDGLAGEAVVVFKGVMDAPREMDGRGFACDLSSREVQADRAWGRGRG